MKILGWIGLLFFFYCLVQIIAKWQYRNTTEKTLWFIVIALGGGWCLYLVVR